MLSRTHPAEKPCLSEQAGSGGKEVTFLTCVCDISTFIFKRFGQEKKREKTRDTQSC